MGYPNGLVGYERSLRAPILAVLDAYRATMKALRLHLTADINRDYAAVMNYGTVDQFLVKILWWHLGFTALMAIANSYLRLSVRFPSPFSWRVLSGREALVATLIGIAAVAIPTLVRGKLNNHFAWRVIVSTAFTVYSYLFVFMSGGSIEMHFHFFMVMALLVVYSDWRLGWIVLVLTTLHHGILNYIAPGWVYFYGRNDFAVIAHALPVIATSIFTSLLCVNNRRTVTMVVAARQDLEQAYIQMVLSLARTVDARDDYTRSHSDQLAIWAEAVARGLGCGEKEIQDIRWGALLHDIGKIGVPDEILRKPGPLTSEEWTVMREHPVVGEEILLPVDRMRTVAKLVRHHQERWDGTGYPDGLRGEEIPLGARILAVVDTYSAMTDDRIYAKRRSAHEAITEIRRCSESQFDPSVVKAFCGIVEVEGMGVHASDGPTPQPGSPLTTPSMTAITRALSQIRRFTQVVPAVTDVAKRLLRPLDLITVLDEILSQIQDVFRYPICGVFFINEQTQELHVKAQRGYDPEVAKSMRLRVGEQGIAGWVASHGRPYYAPDVTQDPLYVAGSPIARSNVAYPLIVDGRVIGVLDVESPVVDAFSKEIRDLLEAFAVLAALAILRAQRDEDLNRLALTDSLTGLANRRALWDALEREVARTRRSDQGISIAIVELDKFKQINDHFGHLQGDVVLRSLADVMRANSRSMDLPARVGGDEFVLLLPDTDRKAAVQIAERLRRHVEEIAVPGSTRLTVSVGLASMPADGDTAQALMEAADRAMYKAKHVGGNRVNVA